MTETADIIIIGAGVAGLGAGFFLAGDAKVIVLEACEAPATQTSGRSAAVYLTTYGPPGVIRLSIDSGPFYADPPDAFTDTALLTPRGELHLDDRGGEILGPMIAKGEIEEITFDEALAMVPILKREGVARCAFDPVAQDIDVDLVCRGFERGLKAAGGRVVLNAEVKALTRADSIWRVETPAGDFEAPIVVNAAGAWASPVAALAGAMPIHIEPRRRSAAIVPLPDGIDCRDWPLFFGAGETWYARPTGGALMVSPAEAIPVEPQDIQIDKYDEILAGGLDRYQQRVTVPITHIERPWAGLRNFAPDGEPVAGFDPEAEGFFWLAGQGGYGFQTAPALSRLAADLVLGRTPSDANLVEALSPARLAE
ncbi:MAG: FAD-binding oxidoreductase [Pseudomonadota bacterium]